MTMWKRWIYGGVLCGLLLGGVVGCSMVASPPVSQIAPTDHAASWPGMTRKRSNFGKRRRTWRGCSKDIKTNHTSTTWRGGPPQNSIWFSTATTLSVSIRRPLKKPTSYPGDIAAC
jgi:hypothetical protein